MSIVLLVMTDGRQDCIKQTIPSGLSMLQGPITQRFIFDDSGDGDYREWLHASFPTFKLLYEPQRQGFGGAIQAAWNHIKQRNFDYVFHLEDDFTFNREVPLEAMVQVLEENPHVYQMALRRQAWNSEEIQAGGVIERWPNEFHQQNGWISHRLFFTTNPNLYRRSLIETRTYPNVKDSEGHFSLSIINSDPGAQFGYWGQKTDSPWVNHIGVQRQGNIY